MLDGAAKVPDLVAEAARLGQKAMAITDHGYLLGAYEFWSKARKAGVKPIIGLEAYLTPGPPVATRPGCAGVNRTRSPTTSPVVAPSRT